MSRDIATIIGSNLVICRILYPEKAVSIYVMPEVLSELKLAQKIRFLKLDEIAFYQCNSLRSQFLLFSNSNFIDMRNFISIFEVGIRLINL